MTSLISSAKIGLQTFGEVKLAELSKFQNVAHISKQFFMHLQSCIITSNDSNFYLFLFTALKTGMWGVGAEGGDENAFRIDWESSGFSLVFFFFTLSLVVIVEPGLEELREGTDMWCCC